MSASHRPSVSLRPHRAAARIAGFALILGALCAAAPALALTEVTGFGSNPGNLRMYKYVPPGLPA